MAKMLGILGGLGPMSTVYFYEMITRMTQASCDQDHIDMVISSHATTPDRTAYIIGESGMNPLDVMVDDARKLQTYGAEVIAIPCNTAHFFYRQIQDAVTVPVLNIIEETVSAIRAEGVSKVGLLATVGTISTHTYQRVCEREGVGFAVPDNASQQALMRIIYDDIKGGRQADRTRFDAIVQELFDQGCERLILGCTELSIVKSQLSLPADRFTDSLEVLARATIRACGKEVNEDA